MHPLCTLFLLCVCLLSSISTHAQQQTIETENEHGPAHPNIIILLMDDQDLLLGSPSYMPNLQRQIVGEGVSFTNAFVSTPVCCPSRTELISGNYFHNIGAPNGTCMHIDATGNVLHNENNLFQLFYKHGYKTGVFGKLTNQDSKYFCSHSAANVTRAGMSRVYSMCEQEDYYCAKYLNKFENETVRYTNLSYDEPSTYQTAQIGNASLQWIRELLSEKAQAPSPFLAYIGVHCPHVPNTVPPWFVDAFANVSAPRNQANFNVQIDGQMEWVNHNPRLDDGVNGSLAFIDQKYRNRLRSALQMDVLIDELMALLTEFAALNHTYVLYTSDHGYHLGQWRLGCEKSFMFDTDIRVPFYIRGPPAMFRTGIGNTSEAIVIGNVDILPTVLELANIQVGGHGGNASSLFDGKSFAKQLLRNQNKNKNNSDSDAWAWPRTEYLIEYMAHANQYFNECRAWYENAHDFHGDVVYPSAFQSGDASDGLGFVDYGDGVNPNSNTFREIRILNETHNLAYAEYIRYKFSEADKENPYLFVLYDLKEDPFQVRNVYNQTPVAMQQSLHQMLMEYANCRGDTCP